MRVMATGTFDLLHPGHVLFLEKAKELGGEDAVLIVVIAKDTTVERRKRVPIIPEEQMKFLKFMKLCAARVGSIFNASEICGELGVDSKTVSHWLSVLQASYLVTLLPPYYENITKRLVKTPKLYFNDPGLACYLLDIESPEARLR